LFIIITINSNNISYFVTHCRYFLIFVILIFFVMVILIVNKRLIFDVVFIVVNDLTLTAVQLNPVSKISV